MMTTPPIEASISKVAATLQLPPLSLLVVGEGVAADRQRVDVVLEISGTGFPTRRFAAEYKRQWTPQQVAMAVSQARTYAQATGLLPMVIVPYLSEERLLELEAQGVSGLDLCGNGVVTVPGKYTIFRTGKPSRFKSSAPIKNIYRGATSLVARSFLLTPTYTSVNALADAIRSRGGVVSQGTISKALAALEEDILIGRGKEGLRLLQAQKLLELLERNNEPIKATREFVGRSSLELPALMARLTEGAAEADILLAATGTSSTPHYISFAMESVAALYCSNISSLLDGLDAQETNRFPNLRLLETDEPIAFFDRRPDAGGYPWASPLQTYLEMLSGDPRLKQSAPALRENLLKGGS